MSSKQNHTIGEIGSTLANRLIADGHEVAGFPRDGERLEAFRSEADANTLAYIICRARSNLVGGSNLGVVLLYDQEVTNIYLLWNG